MSKIVLVEWADASSNTGWHHFGMADCISNCVSVGILTYEDDKQIVLCPHRSDNETVLDTMAIPKGCIKRMRILKIVGIGV